MKAEIITIRAEDLDLPALERAGRILKEGGLVAFPTETVYGLGGNALDPAASKKIYEAKGRPSDNPLIIHIAEIDKLDAIVREVPREARELARRFWPGPLTMILRKSDIVPLETTGGLETVAVRFPSDPIAQELIRRSGGYVAAPSANASGRPSPTTAAHVIEDLGDRIDMILDGGQVGIGLESTIVDFTEEVPVILRPGYISLSMLQEVLGEVRMDPGLIPDGSSRRPKAPGMKYRHYAPRAELVIVEGEGEEVVREIRSLAAKAIAEGKVPGIIATEETKACYPEGLVVSIGSRKDEETIAHDLYKVLRGFDESEADVIYSEAFHTPRMGHAIMNRLLKAAGHKVINLEKERRKTMIAIGSDQGGFELKQEILKQLDSQGIEYKDYGSYDTASVDYPEYAAKVAKAILSGEADKGILICGTGIGISIAANKFKGIRAAHCSDCFSAEATRLHNDANILAMGGRVVGPGLGCKIVDTFLQTPFSGEERHARRIRKIHELEIDED